MSDTMTHYYACRLIEHTLNWDDVAPNTFGSVDEVINYLKIRSEHSTGLFGVLTKGEYARDEWDIVNPHILIFNGMVYRNSEKERENE